MRNLVICILLVFTLSSLSAQRPSAEYIRLCDWMTGSFNSAQQAEQDSAYYNIDLHMSRIWSNRTDGYWLYVEQAVAANPERPYRQRVYQVVDLGDNQFESLVYELHNPMQYTGAWQKPDLLKGLSMDSLSLRDGCSIILHWNERGYYEGRTGEKTCTSSLRGASYATSGVQIYPELLSSWDRGFDENNEQVWGAEAGPYRFIKQRVK